MAEIAVQFVIQKLDNILTQKADLLFGVDERVGSLRHKLGWMHDFLKDVDGKRKETERVKRLVAQIREVAYDAEDVIDSYIFNIQKQRRDEFMGSIRNFACCIKGIPAICGIGKEIGDIERRISEILSNSSAFDTDKLAGCGEASSSSNQSQTRREKRVPIVDDADLVGVEDQTKTLVRRLIEGDARRAVISITGMGGIGKTTLAKKVYDNIDVKKNFDFHAWVSVSQEHRLREIFLSILKSPGQNERETIPEEDLLKQLCELLEGKKYLVVIDDIWTRDAWNDLVSAFPDRQKGSRVLLTTRNEEIARHADAKSTSHKMHFLNESESWELFNKKALPGNLAPPCLPNLEKLGRKIVAKCGGLPLAIAVIGGVLSRKEISVKEWEKVLKSLVWHLNESEDRISGILALSYHDLPYYLKFCFLYFVAFPENSEIYVDDLIKLWIAEGFVQQRGELEPEDVAEDYVEELIDRCMIQVTKRNSNGTAMKCRIHDLLRDLLIANAKEERFLEVHGKTEPTSPNKPRRLAITASGGLGKFISSNRSTLHLRSLLCFNERRFNERREKIETRVLKSLWRAFKFIRVMDLRNVQFTGLPDEIGSLTHLRYLCLMGNSQLKGLPSTITRLSNLQTLNLEETNVYLLPVDIGQMKQLRHLLLKYECQFSYRTKVHCLSNLQTLKNIWADSWTEDELKKLTNLRELLICGPLNIASCLLRSELKQDPMGTLEKLPNLRILNYRGNVYVTKEMVFSAGGFPLLNDLIISECNELEEWRVEKGAMPNLKSLEIRSCKRLKMLPDGMRHLTNLQELKLIGMPEEFNERVRENEGEDWIKIQHIPSPIIIEKGRDRNIN